MLNKYVCIFAYYEKNDMYKTNLIYFLNNGILDYVDYYIVVNGDYTVKIPDNINVIKRDNIGFDFGAWSHVLNKYINNDYDYYIFINGSVRGPYISEYSINNWLDKFIELFNHPDTKLVGSTINILETNHLMPYTHVQSMFFILNNDGFKYLKSLNFFNEEKINNINNIDLLIQNYEIEMSQLILKKGWNINCIVPYYRDLDYRLVKHNINIPHHISDVVYDNGFFGRTLLPHDVIFYKVYRFTNNELFTNINGTNTESNINESNINETNTSGISNKFNYIIYTIIFIIIIYYLYHYYQYHYQLH